MFTKASILSLHPPSTPPDARCLLLTGTRSLETSHMDLHRPILLTVLPKRSYYPRMTRSNDLYLSYLLLYVQRLTPHHVFDISPEPRKDVSKNASTHATVHSFSSTSLVFYHLPFPFYASNISPDILMEYFELRAFTFPARIGN
ncbi:hypothetical protein CC2G_001843 [Coprinopsis cinerea AmutBmut pab1-1]|nr:hypothetical protein CC2G_001843 [Coprinopsis cinerea AmutBmut pab1-1]